VIHRDRTDITSPTNTVLAPATNASNVGGMTVVVPATFANASVQINDRKITRRMKPPKVEF